MSKKVYLRGCLVLENKFFANPPGFATFTEWAVAKPSALDKFSLHKKELDC